MTIATAIRAVSVFIFVCTSSPVLGQAWVEDDPNLVPEIIDVRALGLFPPAPPARNSLMPSPYHPALHGTDNDPGAAHIYLTDIPFSVQADAGTAAVSLWDRIRSRFAMDELPSPLVKDWENWYSSRPDYMTRMIARGERYLFHVIEEVEKRGMPAEIALLPMIESAYNPTAYSHAHASGMWQFIPSTGKIYGLKQNWWQDERRDVLAATRAALDYLEKLYEMFGNWELALAAYNWGEGAVGRAMQRNESRGQRTDYLSLDMPAETRNYLPKLLAVKNLIARPDDFGLVLAEVPNRPYFAVVTTERHIDVKLAAQFAGMTVEEFQALNPSHNRPVIRAEPSQPILLPADRVERFQASFEAHGEPLVTWQSYTIGKQDSLEKIAARFGIPAARLQEVNSLSSRLRNIAGLTILVPAAREKSDFDVAAAGFVVPSAPEPAPARRQQYVVKPGETLSAIAQRFGVSVAQLATRNGIRNGRVLAGQTLTIDVSAPVPQSVQSAARTAPRADKAAKKQTAATSAKTRNAAASTAKKSATGRVQVAYTARSN